MKTSETGCIIFPIQIFRDSRGSFSEVFRDVDFGLDFKQDNVSVSFENVVRGMHFQTKNPQGKLVRVLSGEVTDAVIDLRIGSPSYGKMEVFKLKPDDYALFVPPGFAHGFWAHETSVFFYKCTEIYDKESDGGINPLDPDYDFPWKRIIPYLNISEKDRALPYLRDFQSPFSM